MGIARGQDDWWVLILIGVFGVACLIRAQAFTTAHRPPRREPPQTVPSPDGKPKPSPNNIDQRAFVENDLVWSILSAIGVTIFVCSRLGTAWVANSGRDSALLTLALAGAVVFALGWIAGWPARRSRRDFVSWSISGLVYGALVGAGAVLFKLLDPYSGPPSDLTLLLPIIFGIPWALTSQLAAEMIFVGLVSYESDSDSDREWLGRAAGFVTAAAIVWAATAFLSLAVGHYIIHEDQIREHVRHLGAYIATLGGMSGIATALIGKSSLTSATPDDDDRSRTGVVLNLVLAVAGPVFLAALIVGLSVALDLLLIGNSLVHALNNSQTIGHIVFWIVVGGIVAAVDRHNRVDECQHQSLLFACSLPKPSRARLPRRGSPGAKSRSLHRLRR